MRSSTISLAALSALLLPLIALPAQEPPSTAPAQERPAAAATPGRGATGEPRPYDQVITREAKSDPGVFTVHRIRERILYEIPKEELNTEFLWVTQIAKTASGAGYGGQAVGNRVVRWERVRNRVLLRNVSYDTVADRSQPIALAVGAANNDSIIMAFDVDAIGKADSVVIDVTRLFTTEVPEFSARARIGARGFDQQRSFIERAVSFPENIEVEASHTYTSGAGDGAAPRGGQGLRSNSGTIVAHFSMIKLPAHPMTPRLFDDRVGYFSIRQMDYGRPEHRAQERIYITRYRLEKKDPAAATSEPVKPIVYWIDPATPLQWRPYVKKAIESWQSAFEAAGYRNAIVAKQGPTPEEDPEWSAEDARYSVIRWLPSTTENASGPSIRDPRTGEILEADIQLHHNVQNLIRDWYFIQVSPLDPRAQKLPLPETLMGDLLAFVIAHEVGHTLGFQHNMKASSTYPAEKLRDREWIKTMGHTPSIMDYARFNYVAQPEDGIDVKDLIPGIGPYDKWATAWGYKPIPGAKTPDDEKPTLDAWAREQDKTPWLRFSTADAAGSDPGDQSEAVGDANAVWSTELAMKNLERVGGLLLNAATGENGAPYRDLEELYGRLMGQWATTMTHVTLIIGGLDTQQKHIGQSGVRFTPVAKERQAEAVRFLNEKAFKVPRFAADPEILRRIEPVGVLSRVSTAQNRVLTSLLQAARLQRLVEEEALDGAAAYKPTAFLADLRKGIFSELESSKVTIDPYRRNLQRTYLDIVADRVNNRAAANAEQRALLRGELRALTAAIETALRRTATQETRLHLEDLRDQIAKALDPRFLLTAQPAPVVPSVLPEDPDPGTRDFELFCWPDFAIRRVP